MSGVAEPGLGAERDVAKPGRRRRTAPTAPDNDPFYRSDFDLAGVETGTVLRSRAVELAVAGVVPQRVRAWQLLFRSSDHRGEPTVAVTTVLLPSRAGGAVAARPLLSYQCAIDAVSAESFPSYALRRGTRSLGGAPSWELLLIGSALRRGWAVSIPDHEGPRGRWGAPREPGHIILDGIRAALGFAELGLNADSPTALWGYSGGGLASAWAAELAAAYAPEIKLVGAALGSPVGNPASVFLRLNTTRFAGLPALFVAGLCRTFPEVDELLRRHCTSEGLAVFVSLQQMTTLSAVVTLAHRDLEDLLTIPLADFLAEPTIARVLEDIQPGQQAPAAPIFATQSVHDQLIAVDDVDEMMHRYSNAGAHVTYFRDCLSEHVSLHVLAAPITLDWLADRFAGRALAEPVSTTVLSTACSLRALTGFLSVARQAAAMLLARPIRDLGDR